MNYRNTPHSHQIYTITARPTDLQPFINRLLERNERSGQPGRLG